MGSCGWRWRSPLLGVLVLPLAPLSTLLTLVLMLRVAAQSLPQLSYMDRGETTRQRWQHHLRVASGVLLPFIVVYAAEGLLHQDSVAYVRAIHHEAFITSVASATARTAYADGWVLMMLVGGALVIRKALALTGAVERFAVAALVGCYLEALWMMTLTNAFAVQFRELKQWFDSRVVVVATVQAWEALLEWVGSLAATIRQAVDVLTVVSSGFVTLVMVPLAWLAITGASFQSVVSLREQLAAESRIRQSFDNLGDGTQRVLLEVAEPVARPLRTVWEALVRVRGCGLWALLAFCVAFVAVQLLQRGLTWLMWFLTGPVDPDVREFLTPYQEATSWLFFITAVAALLPAGFAVLTHGHHRPQGATTGNRT